MNNDRPENRNVKATVVGGKYVSSAEIWRHFGTWVASYETFIFEYDEEKKSLGRIIDQTYQRTATEAIKVHDYIVANIGGECHE